MELADLPRLWIDAGPLFRHQGNVAGIQRVAICVIQEWLSQPQLPLGFCGYDARQATYREIDRGDVANLLSTFTTSRTSTACAAWLRPAAGNASRWVLSAQRLRSALGRRVRQLCGKSSSEVRKAPGRQPMQPRAPFGRGDILFLPLNSWNDAGIAEALTDASCRHGVNLVPLLYDVIPLSQPHLVSRGKNAIYGEWVRNLLGVSVGMVTISEHSRREIIDASQAMGLAAPPIEVVRLGDEVLSCVSPRRPRELPADLDQGFVLSLGSICKRKNQRLLLQVWRRLIERHGSRVPPLVLVGRVEKTSQPILQEIRGDRAVQGRLFVLEHAPDAETRWLLEHCLFTMFPSHYEGWGLPVAESLALGKYCIASGASSLPEIAGVLIDYHPPGDVEACQNLVEQALFTPGLVAQREQRIRQQFRSTTWKSCAEAVLRFIVEHGAHRGAHHVAHPAQFEGSHAA